ncbi:ParA family protein [Muricoccus nepalensis]|nr:ParA family protein [Roseomonas nepalensis]
MGTIVTVASGKGGVGKTTVVILLATTLAKRMRVAVIDADPNRRFTEWAGLYEGPAITVRPETDTARLASLPRKLAAEHDVVLLDIAGFGSQALVVAVAAANGVLIPTKSDRGSVLEAAATAELTGGMASTIGREIPCRIITVAFDERLRADAYALDQIRDLGLTRAQSGLRNRTGYKGVTWSGSVPSLGPIAVEGESLADELISLGWVPARSGTDYQPVLQQPIS